MIILGINTYHADASAAIFVNGKLVAAIEEERFRRIKHLAGFPQQSIQFCLQEAGITYEDVDYFAIGRDPKAKFLKKVFYLLFNPNGSIDAVRDRIKNSRKVSSVEKELSVLSGMPESFFINKIKNVEHHRSHIASTFFASPFDNAVCVSIDGSGDFTTTMTAVGNGNQFRVLNSVDFPHSIGIFYTAFTQLLGFPFYGDEYKVMGMASYGTPKYMHELQDVVTLTKDGLFRLNLKYFRKGTAGVISYGEDHIPIVETMFSELMIEKFGQPREGDQPLTQHHKDLAASVQKMTEVVIYHILNHLYRKTGITNLCIAGGVAQNSVANGKITSNTNFKKVYIPSAGHDAGISMGAALYVQHQFLKTERQKPIFSAYTGSQYSNIAIKEVLNRKNIAYTQVSDEQLYDLITDCLIGGGVVGWMNGRSEFGPRALGARSILVDPRRADAKELLNLKIKRRENFRPFAPSILKEYVSDYFEVNDDSPFMEKVLPIKKEKHHLIPAVTHVDGTGRLQTVDKMISGKYYALIETFRKKTGIPILLNTSFNENEPIVNTPEEALACFLRTDMDMLAMENIIVRREDISI